MGSSLFQLPVVLYGLDPHDELVTAKPVGGKTRSKSFLQPLAELFNKPVPVRMAQGIIDELELVQIKEQKSTPLAHSRLEMDIGLFIQSEPVG
ncbi:hypothetical protein D3C71_1854090 [compost metagenome]